MPPTAHTGIRHTTLASPGRYPTHAFQRLGGKSPVPVLLHASDPLSDAGVRAHLADQRAVALVGDISRPGTVSLLVADSADDETVTQWCAGAASKGLRAVLVTARLRQSGLADIIAGGIGAVAWRHEATGPRLVRAVTAVARGEGDVPADLIRALMDHTGGTAVTGMCRGAPLSQEVCRTVLGIGVFTRRCPATEHR
ncbi:helix-turn-helix transcriptional regulator [Streptomyces sp. CB01373]|uniref:helix-turn-helix transcriptional regulator n=1 Tax=Streptomyces sp. CB01373 TaxID=2020325 RepID=UPI000C27FD96|nr:helix-turn-helix transcriptional regulator [Streptomyces sp. CB01373]PJM91794.1 helix-turn-helix transcriptional regulator [Streptomyces sp. CB01373]